MGCWEGQGQGVATCMFCISGYFYSSRIGKGGKGEEGEKRRGEERERRDEGRATQLYLPTRTALLKQMVPLTAQGAPCQEHRGCSLLAWQTQCCWAHSACAHTKGCPDSLKGVGDGHRSHSKVIAQPSILLTRVQEDSGQARGVPAFCPSQRRSGRVAAAGCRPVPAP
eukprot:1149934-Pelagomonas_calceolata.AAC.1